jgi:hypothetical protein
MGGECGANGGFWEVHTTFWLGGLKGGDQWVGLGVDGG